MRRRKPRVVWLPQTNANSIGDNTAVYQLFLLSLGGSTGSHVSTELPMVLDSQQSPVFDPTSSLSDIESSGYRLRRIVGKIWIQCGQTVPIAFGGGGDTNSITPFSAIVTAGFIVRKAETATGRSLASFTGDDTSISPALIENSGDPWIWRRSWLVGNNWARGNVAHPEAGVLLPINPVPTDNYAPGRGGIADGPHVDQKTARIVGPEERLFLDVTATVLSESGDSGESPLTIAVITDIRCLGSLRTSTGNRRNASR